MSEESSSDMKTLPVSEAKISDSKAESRGLARTLVLGLVDDGHFVWYLSLC